MKSSHQVIAIVAGIALSGATLAHAADWPQWRGANRDARASDFKVPATWPKELTQKWKTEVGEGDATPALVGDRVYVFARQGSDEVTLCLNAADGKEIWRDKYPAVTPNGPSAREHSGPRSSPAVAEGKVVTFGVGGVLSCLDADKGTVVWRKESNKEFSPAWPMFYTAMSPLIVDGLCIAHLGGSGNGAVVAYDLKTGDGKWEWKGEGPAYSSPVVMTVDGMKQVVEVGEKTVVGLSLADGKLLWQTSPQGAGGGGAAAGGGPGGRAGGPAGRGGGPGGRGGRGGGMRAYNSATPIVDGSTVIVAGNGIHAFTVEKSGDGLAVRDLWSNPEISTSFNTPVLKNEMLFGISGGNELFCLDAKTGKKLWTHAPEGGGGRGGRGFGSVVDAGSVLLSLTPASDLIVFQPSGKEYSQVANIKVASTPTYAYPIVSGDQILIKDQDSAIMYTVQ